MKTIFLIIKRKCDFSMENCTATIKSVFEEELAVKASLTVNFIQIPELSDDGCTSTYYEQMYYNDRWYRRGDFVYVYNPLKNRTAILRIDKMWRTSE